MCDPAMSEIHYLSTLSKILTITYNVNKQRSIQNDQPIWSLYAIAVTFSPSLTLIISLSLSHTHTLSLNLPLSHSLSSPDVRCVCIFDLVRYLNSFLSGHIAPGWGIRVFNSLATANRQLCALSSPSDNSSLYSTRQPATTSNLKNQNVPLREYI